MSDHGVIKISNSLITSQHESGVFLNLIMCKQRNVVPEQCLSKYILGVGVVLAMRTGNRRGRGPDHTSCTCCVDSQ